MITEHLGCEYAKIERARVALSYLDPNCDRETWVKYGMGLKQEFGDTGFDVWDAWSAQSEKYSASDTRSAWKSFKHDGGITLGSLIFDAKKAGFKDDAPLKQPSESEIAARQAAAVARAALAAEEDAENYAKASAQATAIWDAASPTDSHPYLTRKGVSAHGLRVGRWERVDVESGEVYIVHEQALLVPIRDKNRQLWSLQAIFPCKINGRDKDYLRGGKKTGNFHHLGTKPKLWEERPVYLLGEGYATCASAYAARGDMVLVCFDTSGLLRVAEQLRESKPNALIILLADNDSETKGNPGLTAARKAAAAVGGLVAVPPPGDFNDLLIAEGPGAVRIRIEEVLASAPISPDPAAPDSSGLGSSNYVADSGSPAQDIGDTEESHFIILGYGEDKYFFFHKLKRQVLERSRHDFTDVGLAELAPRNWWESVGLGKNKGGVDKAAAAEWIFEVAHKRGYFDVENRLRGRGAWSDNGRSVFHHGSHLTVDGVFCELMQICQTRYIYENKAPLPSVGKIANSQEGERLIDTAKLMRWVNPSSALLLCGWVFLAPICGALKWRPHIWVTGESGSGKSVILRDFVGRLLGPAKLSLDAGDSTAAGVRQKLKRDALPVLLDEAEGQDERGRERIKGILTLARGASTESDTMIAKGTVAGRALEFSVRSMFCLGAIGAIAQEQQSDNSRFATLALRNKADNSNADQWSKLKTELADLEIDTDLSARLSSRAIQMLPEVRKCISVFSAAVAKRLGAERFGDQYGTLLAGCWCLAHDVAASEKQAQEVVDGMNWSGYAAEKGQATPDAAKCLNFILENIVVEKGSSVSIHTLISVATGMHVEGVDVEKKQARRILQDRGITITKKNGVEYLGIIRDSRGVKEMLRGTPFASDWQTQLPRIDGYVPLPATSYGVVGQNRGHGFPLKNIQNNYGLLEVVDEDGEPPI